jgi:hypothetical protein
METPTDAIRGSVAGGVEGRDSDDLPIRPMEYRLSQLDALEAESIHVFREVVAGLERPVLLLPRRQDSIVMLRLAERAFWPTPIPFPVLRVDTGHNFAEVLAFRDRRVGRGGRNAAERASSRRVMLLYSRTGIASAVGESSGRTEGRGPGEHGPRIVIRWPEG